MKLEKTASMDELMNSVTSDDVEWEQVGRDFFAQNYEPAQVAAFFSYLLDQKFYEQICTIARCGNISAKPLTREYLLGKSTSTSESAFFDIFIKTAIGSGLTLRDLMPFLVASFTAPKNSRLGKWKGEAENFLTAEAQKDFDVVSDLLSSYDPKYTAYEPLIKADKDKTIDMLINRLLFSKHINKTAIRKFLLNHKIEVTENLEVYKSSSVKVREAIVRLLLLFKHDNNAAGFLDSISETETSSSVLKLMNKDFLPLTSDNTAPKSNAEKTGGKKDGKKSAAKKESIKLAPKKEPLEEFSEYMIEGREWGVLEFTREILGDQLKSIIASTLFFSVYGGSVLTDIVVVEQGKICDLDNREIMLDPGKRIRVLHPAEIPSRYEYIKRLNIQQGINQLRRKTFLPGDAEKSSGVSLRLKGTVIRIKDLKKNMRALDFKPLNKSPAGLYFGAGVRLGGHFCSLSFTAADLDEPSDENVTAGDIRFYRYNDLITLGGRIYTENVPLCPVYGMEARVFSELMYSVYRLCSRE